MSLQQVYLVVYELCKYLASFKTRRSNLVEQRLELKYSNDFFSISLYQDNTKPNSVQVQGDMSLSLLIWALRCLYLSRTHAGSYIGMQESFNVAKVRNNHFSEQVCDNELSLDTYRNMYLLYIVYTVYLGSTKNNEAMYIDYWITHAKFILNKIINEMWQDHHDTDILQSIRHSIYIHR